MAKGIPHNKPTSIDPEDYSPVRKIRAPFYYYNPHHNIVARDYQEILATDEFLQSFKTPSDIEQYKNYILSRELEETLGVTPFETISEQRAVFNPEAEPLDITIADTPEKQAFTEIYNQLVKYKGRIPSPNFIQRSWGKNMTNSWIKLITGEDMSGLYDDFSISNDGFKYKGELLNLTPSQSEIVNDFLMRTSGEDIDKDFLDNVSEIVVGLTMDLPLLMLTGGISAKILGATTVGRALMTSNSLLGRLLGEVTRQSVNFNILGFPQTVEATRDNGFAGMVDAIWHSSKMGMLAAATGTLGSQLFKPFQWVGVGKEFVKNNPILAKEIGSLAGSFGFGYASEKLAGMSDIDAIATGMAFAATHFTNPNAYRRVMREQISKSVLITTEKFDGETNPFTFIPDYFVERDNKLYKIKTDDFRDRGIITELNVEPIEITDEIRAKIIPYNHTIDHIGLGFYDTLAKMRFVENAKKLYDAWVQKLPEKYTEENEEALKRLALFVSASGATENARKLFGKWKLPDDSVIQDKIIKFANEHKVPYDVVKRFIVTNIRDYVDNSEVFHEKLERFEGVRPRIVDEINELIAEVDKIVVNNALAKWGLLEIKEPNRRIIKPRLNETFPQYFTRVMDMKYPNAIKTKVVDGVSERVTDHWWGLDYEKYRTEQVILQSDYDSFRKKVEKEAKEEIKGDKKGVRRKETALGEQIKEETIDNTAKAEKVEPTQFKEEFNLLKTIIDAYDPQTKSITYEVEQMLIKESERLRDIVNEDIKGKRGTVQSEEMAVLLLRDSGLTEPEIKLILDKTFNKNVDVTNIKRKFKKDSKPYQRLVEKGVINRIGSYTSYVKSEIQKSKEGMTEPESVERYVEDKDVAELINEETSRHGERPITNKRMAEEISGEVVEPERREHEKPSEKEIYINSLKQMLIDSGYDITKADIMKARDDGVLTDNEAADLMRAVSKKKSQSIIEGKYKREEDAIETVARFYLNKGLTVREALDKAVEEGRITSKDAEELKKLYGRNLDTLFNTSKLSDLQPATQEERDAFIKATKEKFNVDVEFGEVSQEGTESNQYRTGMTYTEDGRVKIRINELANKETFEEETFHATMLAALDQEEVIGALTKIAKWNGEMSDWSRAHEDLYRQYQAYRRGYMPRNRFFAKIREWLDRIARWFGFHGFKDAENFFRRYEKGLIQVDKDGYNKHAEAVKRVLFNLPQRFSEGVIRTRLKSFDFIDDNETIDLINPERFFARLKNKGVKDTEINYLRYILRNEQKLKGFLLKEKVLRSLYPLKIRVLINKNLTPTQFWGTLRATQPETYDLYYKSGDKYYKPSNQSNLLNTIRKGKSNIDDFPFDTIDMASDKWWRTVKFRDLPEDVRNNYKELLASFRREYEKARKQPSDAFNIATTSQASPDEATNYRVLLFDAVGVNVKQIHDYWRLYERTKNSVGWARVEDEVINGSRTGRVNVNEIQHQLQYSSSIRWEDLKPGDVVKIEGNKYRYVEEINPNVKIFESLGEDRRRHHISRKKYSMGSDNEYLRSIKPIFHELQIRSLIQYFAEAGYRAVRFPTMKSVAKIQAFDAIKTEIDFLRNELNVLRDIELRGDINKMIEILRIAEESGLYNYGLENRDYADWQIRAHFREYMSGFEIGINDLENRYRTEAEPVMRFYEETVGMAGRKLRKDNWYRITDDYNNEWFETTIKPEDVQSVYLYNTVLQDLMNKNRIVTADKHVDELNALYNTVGTEGGRLDEKFTASRIKNLIELAGRKNPINYNTVRKIIRELRPPVIEKETSPRFKSIYEIGEREIIREIPGIRSEMIRKHLKDGAYLNTMSGDEIVHLLESYERYSQELRDGVLSGELSVDDFKKRYGFNEKQSQMVDAYQNFTRDYNRKAREWWKEYLFVEGGNLAKGVSKRKLAKLMPDLVEEKNGRKYIDIGKANEYLNQPENADVRMELADYIAKKMYPEYSNKVIYINEVRPSDPSYYTIRLEKLSDNPNHTPIKDESGNIIGYKDYVDTYAQNEKQAKEIIQQWEQKGFKLVEYYKNSDIIKGHQWDKLTLRQLMNLLELGHIQLSYIGEDGRVHRNPIVDKLLNAVKSGTYRQHSIYKGHIRGMHYTEREYEYNLHKIGDEVLNIKRQIAIIKLHKQLANWQVEIDPLIKSPTLSQLEKEKELRAYEYAQKYINNITHSDRNFIDTYKGYVGMYYTSMKMSFFVQQLLQGLQTTWHLARGLSKSGNSHFAEGTTDAWKLIMYLRAKHNGQPTDVFGISDEVDEIYQWLADRKKLGKVGVAELTEVKTDLEYKYMTGTARKTETFKRIMNIPSAAIEKFTRMQSMMTFYKIGKERGLSGEELKHFIADNIDLSMSEWGVGGRSPLFSSSAFGKAQHPVVKALDKSFFTFKTFATHNLALYEYLMRNKLWGALGTKLAAGVAFHGLTKFPLMATMWAIVNIFTDDDVDYEALRLLEDLDNYVPKLGTLMARGVGGFAGISMENLFDERSILPTDTWDNLRSRSWEGKLAEALLGAPYGLAGDVVASANAVYDFLKHVITSDRRLTKDERENLAKSMARFTPLYVRNIYNAMAFDRDGVELRGRTIIKREDLDWRDVILKLMSFNPLKYAKAYEEQFSGFPAKWARINGKINELKRIRKELHKENAPPDELRKLAKELESLFNERSRMIRTKDYHEAKSKGLI